MKKKIGLILALAMIFTTLVLPVSSWADQSQIYKYNTVTIAFSGDISSQMNSHKKSGQDRGGYALMRSALRAMNYNYVNSMFVFSPGNYAKPEGLCKYTYDKDAADLSLLSSLAFDAVTVGGGELAQGDDTYRKMINTAEENAASANTAVPAILCSNLDLSGAKDSKLEKRIDSDYTVLQKGLSKVATFGIMDEKQLAGNKTTGIKTTDPVAAAKEQVDKINNEYDDIDIIVCLYSGSDVDTARALAKQVKGINLIVTGDKTKTDKEITEGKTSIVSAGEGSDNLGLISFSKSGYGDYKTSDYKMLTLETPTYIIDATIAAEVTKYEDDINSLYFSKFGFSYNEELGKNNSDFAKEFENLNTEDENGYGEYIADAYKYSVRHYDGVKDKQKVDVALVSSGAIKKSIDKGMVTPEQIFDISGTKKGSDNLMGMGMVSFYVNSNGLKSIAEADVSVGANNPDYRLHMSGLTYEYNPSRFTYNKTFNVKVGKKAEKAEALEKGKLYRVVCDAYTYDKLSQLRNASDGVLSLDIFDKDGKQIVGATDLTLMSGKTEYKQWETVADYIKYKGKISSKYEKGQNRKVLNKNVGKFKDLNKAGKIKLLMYCIPIVIIIIIIIIILIIRGRRRASRMFISERQKKAIFAPPKRNKKIFANNNKYRKRRMFK